MSLSTLLNAGRCEYLWCDLALLLFAEKRFGELPEDNSSSTGVSTSSRPCAPFRYRERSGALLDRCLVRLFRQDHFFFLSGPTNDRFHSTDVQRNLAIPSSTLLTPPVYLHDLTPMKKLIFGQLDHRVARHCNCVR